MLNLAKIIEKSKPYLVDYFFLIILIFSVLVIWLGNFNTSLFLILNSHHTLLPDNWWKTMDFVVDVRLYIYPILLLLITLILRRKKIINVIMLTIFSIIVFELLEVSFINIPRPYMSFPHDTFFWLGSYGDSDDLGYQAFPSEHIGGLAIFSFAINELFFKNKFWIEFIVLIRVILISIARVFTGWHWPLDVLFTILISYGLVEICLNIDFILMFKKLKVLIFARN